MFRRIPPIGPRLSSTGDICACFCRNARRVSVHRPGTARRHGRPGLALIIMLSAQLMIVLDMTVVNIALPHIQAGLHFSTASLSWVLNAYTLTFGGLLLLGGRAGDILGRRRVFLAGIALFTAVLAGRRPGHPGRVAAGRPGPAGGRRRAGLTRGARAGRGQLRRRPRADPGAGHLLRGAHGRRLAGPGARAASSPSGPRGAGCCSSTCRSASAGHRGDPVFITEIAAPAGPVRPGRRGDLHRRDDRAGLRLHPGRGQRLVRPADAGRVRGGRGAARCCSAHRDGAAGSRSPRCGCSPSLAPVRLLPGPAAPGGRACSGCSSS